MTGAALIQALEIPLPIKALEQLSHSALVTLCGYGRNSNDASLRKQIENALSSGRYPHLERDVQSHWLEEHRR